MSLPNLRGFAKLTVYATSVKEGDGTEANPHRVVTTYFSGDGKELWADYPPRGKGHAWTCFQCHRANGPELGSCGNCGSTTSTEENA